MEYPDNTTPNSDYQGDDDLRYCGKCHTPKEAMVYGQKCPIPCKCEQDERDRQQAAIALQKREDQFIRLQSQSLLGKRYYSVSFDKSHITQCNGEAFEKCRKYVEKPRDMIAQNIGLYIYGGNSSGKTHSKAPSLPPKHPPVPWNCC